MIVQKWSLAPSGDLKVSVLNPDLRQVLDSSASIFIVNCGLLSQYFLLIALCYYI